ncbi:uncharacterized protein [Halyomorpha halys]|uniref:uncharacterized protein isoform X3 n=1 Tax=Halyomorpha halys TaxID=286706 RepID=UPI000D0C8EFF|nr:uncharacterized protein LOC106685703 isoform X3 [Halyomorpha halys]
MSGDSMKIIARTPKEANHKGDVVALWYQDNKLISGSNDENIKVWTENLEQIASWQAHPVNVYSVAVLDDTLYSCSNDGTIKTWQYGTWEFKKNLMENQSDEIIKLCANEGKLYAGNTQGEIFVFQNEELIATYYLHEDIMDFLVLGPLVFNARNVDISVTEMMGGPRFNYMSRGAMIGRFPIRLVGDKICFLSRCAKCIYVHATSKEDKFKRIAEIKAHDMTITGMCHLPGKEHIMLTGGYDRVVKAWDLNTKKKLAQLDIGVCMNEIHPGPPGQVYITGSDGFIVRMEANL